MKLADNRPSKRCLQLVVGKKKAGHVGMRRIGMTPVEATPEAPPMPLPELLPLDEKRRIAERMRSECEFAPSFINGSIKWNKFELFPAFDAMKATAEIIMCDSAVSKAKIGITGSPLWRFFECHGHCADSDAPDRKSSPMVSHYEAGWAAMHVLTVEVGAVSAFYESELIDGIRNGPLRGKLANVKPGGDGPVKSRQPWFVYIITM